MLSGPGLPDESSEWGYEEWRTQMIYASATLRKAALQRLDEEVLLACCEQYEQALMQFAQYDSVVLRAMRAGMHNFPWQDPGAIGRQRALLERIDSMSED